MRTLSPFLMLALVAVLAVGIIDGARSLHNEKLMREQAQAQVVEMIEKSTGQKPVSMKTFNCNQQGPTACAGMPFLVKAIVPNEDKTEVSEVRLWAGGSLGAILAKE